MQTSRSSSPTAPGACRRRRPSAFPEALKQQLAACGRLIIPVGEFGYQTLMRVRRTGEHSLEEEDFGAVAFVPLIGEQRGLHRDGPGAW